MLQIDPNIHMLLNFNVLLISFIMACVTAYYASTKGRNPVLWFFLGAFFGVIALLILFILSFMKNGSDEKSDVPTMTVSRPDSALHPSPSIPLDLKRAEEEDKLWYYLDQNHQQMGPVSIVALRELWNTGRLELASYVWTEGMEKWQKVEYLPALKAILNKE